jgi:hypothetical protein
VHDALRDALAVKVRHLVDKGAVLDEERAAGTHRHRVQLVRQGLAVTRGQTLRVLKIGQLKFHRRYPVKKKNVSPILRTKNEREKAR